jgi:prepilin-type N-terminal cleavage/methylation domain-containing protein
VFRKLRNEEGFTLIELIVIIIIVGILAAIAIPRYIAIAQEAHEANMDSVAGSIHAWLAEEAGNTIINTGTWDYPEQAEVTISNVIAAESQAIGDEWVDNGAGVWTYTGASSNGTITYIKISTEEYSLSVLYP